MSVRCPWSGGCSSRLWGKNGCTLAVWNPASGSLTWSPPTSPSMPPHSSAGTSCLFSAPPPPTCKPTVPGRQQALDHHVLTSITPCTDQPAGLQRKGPPPGDLAGGHVFSSLVGAPGRGNLGIPSHTTSPAQPRSKSILAYLEHLPSSCLSFRQSCAGGSSPVRFQLPRSQC